MTSGIYTWLRHPGYAGWMLWAVGTQLVLCNPLCTVAFTAVTWRFFSQRIAAEDFYLSQFFGGEYLRYRATVRSGIPGIR